MRINPTKSGMGFGFTSIWANPPPSIRARHFPFQSVRFSVDENVLGVTFNVTFNVTLM
jgi:hypothetical protein